MIDFEATIIGAGVVGLSIARELSKSGKKVLVIEKNKSFGEENSSRNSGVIHAGIYYNENTLKDKWCAKGNARLYSYVQERKINFIKKIKRSSDILHVFSAILCELLSLRHL